jgi:hopene-associated glycosyltransferase HpnB
VLSTLVCPVLACLALAIWIWLLAGHGRFWISGPTLARGRPLRPSARVAVVVPARDEVEQVAETLRSLLGQDFSGTLDIILVDDNSTDGTGEWARQIAATDARLHVLSGQPLPPGWSGKLWAVSQGLQHEAARQADYVLLTDADIVHAPTHLASLTAMASDERLDLVSEMVHLRCQSFAERAAIPAFVFFFQMLYPFARVADRRSNTAAAAGGTMLISRRALDSVGGVEEIRSELIDDVALARRVKSAGFSIWLGHAEEAVSNRRYASFGDIWSMIARTAYVQLRYSPLLLIGTCLGMLLIYAVPVAAAVAGAGLVRTAGITAWAIMALLFQPTLRRYRCSPLWGLALPAIALFYLAATCGSAVRFYLGRGGQWKNRRYPVHKKFPAADTNDR